MPRKIVIQRVDRSRSTLTETAAENEAQLQVLVKDNPDILPVEEFGMTGPLLVIGRETTLSSGAVDLVASARSGELLVAEFKTGPQNPDFRHTVAQLLNYGSDLWQMSYEEFERSVATRYFAGPHCQDTRFRGLHSLQDAAEIIWDGFSEEEAIGWREKMVQQLTTGSFHYMLVAQRFTQTMERTVEYLNNAMPSANFYGIELVRFSGDGLDAFESRTVVRPRVTARNAAPPATEARFLESVADSTYQEALRELLELCRGLGLRFEWGSIGTSIRVQTSDRAEAVTIAWLFPPGKAGWMGLTDLTLGFDPTPAQKTPSAQTALEAYLAEIAALPGALPAKPQWLRAYLVPPQAYVELQNRIAEILAELVRRVNTQG